MTKTEFEQTDILQAGYKSIYEGKENPYLYSSDYWLLFEVGIYLAQLGRMYPSYAKKSRGYTVIVDGTRYTLHEDPTGSYTFIMK